MSDDKGLEVSGQLESIRTTKDGGWRIVFNLPGDHVTGIVMTALATMRDKNLALTVREQA